MKRLFILLLVLKTISLFSQQDSIQTIRIKLKGYYRVILEYNDSSFVELRGIKNYALSKSGNFYIQELPCYTQKEILCLRKNGYEIK